MCHSVRFGGQNVTGSGWDRAGLPRQVSQSRLPGADTIPPAALGALDERIDVGRVNGLRPVSIRWPHFRRTFRQSRWMVSGFDPDGTRRDNQKVIEMKRFDCCPTANRQPDNSCSSLAPGKVILPAIAPGMKQWNFSAGFGIVPVRLCQFVAVARRTCLAQIGGGSRPAQRARNDVVNFVLQATQPFRGPAVFAVIAGSPANLVTQRRGNPRRRHWRETLREWGRGWNGRVGPE